MKRYISLLLILCVLLSLTTSCGGSASEYAPSPDMTENADEAMPESVEDAAPSMDYDTEAPTTEEMENFAMEAGEIPPMGDTRPNPATGGDGMESGEYVDSTEEYDDSPETGFLSSKTSPLSTFSADVDTASYSNMRRQLNYGDMPQGVRIEELVNYFGYDYEPPAYDSEVPFSVTTEISQCPWNSDNALAMIGIQGKRLNSVSKISNNVVFLIDVSGSMHGENKLELLKESFKMLLNNFDKDDIISVVTYSGESSVLADSVTGNQKGELSRIINNLQAGGSTSGYDAIENAYALAEKNFIKNGNNRIILASDGDFNVGMSSEEELQALVETKRNGGIYLSVLGFGMGNLKDSKMETLAQNGNGNYAYIDTMSEARKVLVDEFDSTMFVLAKDVKFQVEFNPGVVAEYRLIGYNNRRLENKDFDDDTKDAGDIGSGHSVTALYELVLVDSVDGIELKYQDAPKTTDGSEDYFTVKLRYKLINDDESRLTEHVAGKESFTMTPSTDFEFASSVAEFGHIVTNSEYKANASLNSVITRASDSMGNDEYGLRAEFVEDIVKQYESLFG